MNKKVVLLDFWASWCGPCRVMHPIVEDIAKEYGDKLEVKKYDVDQPDNQPLMEKYQVQAMPTFFIMKDGEVVEQFVGAQSKTVLKSAIEKALG